MITDEEIRIYMWHLKWKFLNWRTPPVELPAESVIEEVVRFIVEDVIERKTKRM